MLKMTLKCLSSGIWMRDGVDYKIEFNPLCAGFFVPEI